MSKPLVVSVPHSLGQAEALRRIQVGIGKAKVKYAAYGSLDEETWNGSHLDFQVSALKQSLRGTVDVGAEDVTLTMTLPWVLSMMTDKARSFVTNFGTKLLTQK